MKRQRITACATKVILECPAKFPKTQAFLVPLEVAEMEESVRVFTSVYAHGSGQEIYVNTLHRTTNVNQML